MREVICVFFICAACVSINRSMVNQELELKQIQFKRDKAHQELTVEKIREERLLLEARIRELEMTGSFITKEGIVYDQSIDPVN